MAMETCGAHLAFNQVTGVVPHTCVCSLVRKARGLQLVPNAEPFLDRSRSLTEERCLGQFIIFTQFLLSTCWVPGKIVGPRTAIMSKTDIVPPVMDGGTQIISRVTWEIMSRREKWAGDTKEGSVPDQGKEGSTLDW